MKSRIVLFADEGKVLTNGEIFGKQIYLGDGDKPSNYREITDKEYESILNEQDKEHEEM